MSELHFQSLRMPAARLGLENPLPPLFEDRRPFQFEKISGIPEEIVDRIEYGHVSKLTPYTLQDRYNRELTDNEFKVAVVENEFLKATFLLEYGGRLWSLFHKLAGQELLEVNPVFHFANLAIRNAWFSGGVEWNIGTVGHSPFTCSPLFCASLERNDSTPILRFYEWERFRQIPFQIDIYLPDGSPVLFIHVFLNNPNPHDVPMYWWSNAALPAKQGTRVITPSNYAYCLGCEGDGFIRIPVPIFNETDITYPSKVAYASDYFFHIESNNRPWIAALDSKGEGLVHVSTTNLPGRKLWNWGTGVGGKNWQDFLSPGGSGYIEIQAGITRTQLEHLRMPAGEHLSWLEAYGFIQTQPNTVHGSDWGKAVATVENELDKLIPQSKLEQQFELGISKKDKPPLEIIQRGSGWGALESKRREIMGDPPICGKGIVFDEESLSALQAPWISLLNEGTFPINDPASYPNGYVIDNKWRVLLERAIEDGQELNWYAWFHIGVMRYYDGDFHGAKLAWDHSLNLTWTAWTARCLGLAAFNEERYVEAVEFMVAAYKDQPGLLPLAIECGRCMVGAGQSNLFLELFDDIPEAMQNNGRMRLLQAQAALCEGDFQTVEGFFTDHIVVDDLREGEQSLSDLWFSLHEERITAEKDIPINSTLRYQILKDFPLPSEFDFRMNA